MLDTAIVGGGLCGLALAHGLHGQGTSFALFEARSRLGGRILSVPCAASGMMLDLGPAWYWPDIQPRIARLVDELGLASFPQHDPGSVLRLTDPNKKPETLAAENLHGGARRLDGGMAALVGSLSERLPAAALHLEHELSAVLDRGDHVELLFHHGNEMRRVQARRVALALPPRLLDQQARFEPALDAPLREAMRATPTWMAGQAKAIVAYPRPFWREAGQSGNAFVNHEQAVLGEIFDACNGSGEKAALGGFFALPPPFRASIHSSAMTMLIASQLVQIFGEAAGDGEQHIQDWACEPYTCSALDRTPVSAHPEYGNLALRSREWNGKLHFGSSETAAYGGGYLEGALEAAARIHRAFAERLAPPSPAAASRNGACLASFKDWVAEQRASAGECYRQRLQRHLSGQHREQLTRLALLGTVEQVYRAAQDRLGALPFDAAAVGVQRGRSDLTPSVLEAFDGFNKALLDEALLFNRGSCAISNFPGEHDPDRDYVETIQRDLAAAWRAFALDTNALLLAKA
ncbi:MAG: FAD-dependent oxidoreductase, partial [Sulfuricellaceae bacterium]|nr:FAD-dependent oxidoreductase [Sulfuricellaceae bacterium]